VQRSLPPSSEVKGSPRIQPTVEVLTRRTFPVRARTCECQLSSAAGDGPHCQRFLHRDDSDLFPRKLELPISGKDATVHSAPGMPRFMVSRFATSFVCGRWVWVCGRQSQTRKTRSHPGKFRKYGRVPNRVRVQEFKLHLRPAARKSTWHFQIGFASTGVSSLSPQPGGFAGMGLIGRSL